MSDEILAERRGATLWITINRTERRNAINAAVVGGIHAALAEVAGDSDIRAVVLTGAGDKAFCAGGDLEGGTEIFGKGESDPTSDFGRLARLARGVGVPLVARVNGACVAGGVGLLALCDIAIAVDHARFGLPEARIGVFPMQVLAILRRVVLPRHAAELALTGEMIDARRAFDIGLVNHVVAAADLDAKVDEILAHLAAGSPAALRRGKYAIAAMEHMDFEAAIAFAEGQIALAAQGDDAREGVKAFMEKRKPRWNS
ncbi:MAG: enoyl-CoA hydratase/isomerase family protein [Rhizobiaceae bacterium]|nr:enoyl-CoA hydratase/isomerase family protein [Rhizobiaceae bacterium]